MKNYGTGLSAGEMFKALIGLSGGSTSDHSSDNNDPELLVALPEVT